MINTKHEFIREILPKIGSDAFTVFNAIISHSGKSDVVWPGMDRLQKMCTVWRNGKLMPMPTKRMYAAIKVLIDFGLAERFQQRKPNGDFGRRKFKIGSDLVGVTMFGDQEFFMDEDSRLVENGKAINGEAPNGLAINNQTKELPKPEELPKEEELPKKEKKATFKIPKTDEEVRALKIEIYTHLKSKMDERQIGGSKFWAKWVTNEFYDFYSGKDWKVSGRKMKSPKIAASRWFNGNLKRGDYAKICPDDPRYDPLNPWQKNTSERDTGEAEQVFKLYKGRKVYDDAKKELAPKVMRLLSQGIKLETFQAVFDYHAKNDYWRDIERMINQFETAKAAYDKSFNYAS